VSQRLFDHPAIVGRARDNVDSPLELVEFRHALFAADADHVVVAIERMLNHVSAELPRRAHDADSQLVVLGVGITPR
jgi:hypothetical protein